jgi:hypothetical protein
LEPLEDRTLPSTSSFVYNALSQQRVATPKALPAKLSGSDSLQLVSGPMASVLWQLHHLSAIPATAKAGAPATNNSATPLVNNINEGVNLPNPQDTQSETTLLLIPGSGVTPPRIVVGYNDSGSLDIFGQQSFATAPEGKLTGYSVSTDGGASFTDQGTLPTNLNGDIGDPTLARDNASGLVYLTTVPFGEFFGAASLSVFRSYDGGSKFILPVNGAPGINPTDIIDKPWSTVDNFAGPGHGNLYEVFTDFGATARIVLTRSTDGGRSFGPFGGTQIFDGGSGNVEGAFVTVSPDHSVNVFWIEQSAVGKPNRILMAKSTNQGLTFGAPVTVATLATKSVNGDLGLLGLQGQPFRTNAFPQAAASPVNSKDLYVVYNDVGVANGDKADIYFTQSSDGGLHWSAPTRVNKDATNHDQWQPTLAVTPDGNRVGVFWYDRRDDPHNFLINRFGAIEDFRTAGAALFPTNFVYNQVAFPPVNGLDPVLNPAYMGDYDQATADSNFFYTTWGDNRSPSTAHAGNNADIRFAKIPLSGPGGIPANVLVNNPVEPRLNDPSDTQSESTLVVIPGSKPTIVSAFNDSTSVDFYKSALDPTLQFTGYSVSTDGGASFTDKGRLPASSTGDAGDPVLARDNVSGRIYLSAIPYAELVTFFAGVEVFRSTDNGQTFGLPVDSAPGFAGTDLLDKPWITVDNAAGKGQGTVYEVFTDIGPARRGIFLTRSMDGGATWGPSGGTLITGADFVNSFVSGANVVVGPDHSVYVFYLLQDIFSGSARIVMRKSTDFGVTFGHPVLVSTLRNIGGGGDLGLIDNTGRSFRSNAFPIAAVNPVTGHVYVVYDDLGTTPGDKADVFFRQSLDGGSTWGREIRVNDDKTTNDQWQPALAVTPDGKELGVFWYDRRLDPADNLIDRFGVIATLSGPALNFGANFRVTTHSFAPSFGQDPVTGANYMGDYDTVAADNNFFYTTWGDNSLPSKAHAGFNADVRFAKIPVNPNDSAITALATAGTALISNGISRSNPPADSTSASATLTHSSSSGLDAAAWAASIADAPKAAIVFATASAQKRMSSVNSNNSAALVDEFFATDIFGRSTTSGNR